MQRYECRGAPRDLGLDQGFALRAGIRAVLDAERWSRRLAWLRPDPEAARSLRDLRRYFPHQAEWLDGMSLAAGVPLRALVRDLDQRVGAGAARAPALGAGVAPRLARPLPAGLALRDCAPEGRFRSLELAWLTAPSPLLGVNEAGLAVAVVGAPSRAEPVSAPFACFARDCLERFDAADAALEWCLSRPAAAGGGLLFADAGGELVGVDAEGPRRRVLRPDEGWLAAGAAEPLRPDKPAPGGGAELDAALRAALARLAPSAAAVVRVDPQARALWLGDEVFAVAAAPEGGAA